jgi:3-hydroxybutyryl-CoA dehydratase
MGHRITNRTLADFEVGERRFFAKTVTEADVHFFAAVSGDLGPQYVNAVYARTTEHGERVAHPMLVASMAAAAVSRLVRAGFGSESWEFRTASPVRFGDTITAMAEVVEKDGERGRLKLRAVCENQRGEVVLEGTSIQVPIARPAEASGR